MKKYENYYPQVFLNECNFFKVAWHIIDDSESSSDGSDDSDDSDEKQIKHIKQCVLDA